jgi:hypothetical protein
VISGQVEDGYGDRESLSLGMKKGVVERQLQDVMEMDMEKKESAPGDEKGTIYPPSEGVREATLG